MKCDVTIIADPYCIPVNANWIGDKSKADAIWAAGQFPIQELVSASPVGYVIVKINGTFFCSCYAPPSWSIDKYNRMLDKLTDELTGRSPIVVAGDFNAWATDWGSRCTNTRGWSLLEALARLNVDLANTGNVSTFRKNGSSQL